MRQGHTMTDVVEGYVKYHGPHVEVGELWQFEEGFDISRYLILECIPSPYYGYVYRVLSIEDGDIIPDLIIDRENEKQYKAHKVA